MTDSEIVAACARFHGWHQRPQKSVCRPDDPDNPVWCDETGYYQCHVWQYNPLRNPAVAQWQVEKEAK